MRASRSGLSGNRPGRPRKVTARPSVRPLSRCRWNGRGRKWDFRPFHQTIRPAPLGDSDPYDRRTACLLPRLRRLAPDPMSSSLASMVRPPSMAALDWAVAEASRDARALHVVVAHERPPWAPYAPPARDEPPEELKLKELVETVRPHLRQGQGRPGGPQGTARTGLALGVGRRGPARGRPGGGLARDRPTGPHLRREPTAPSSW
jgi:hypothetical protein